MKTDILILGAGGAGLLAALAAHTRNPGLDITVAVKGLFGKSGCTRMVQGGYNAALAATDSVENHFLDTLQGGAWINDQELAWALVSRAPGCVERLETVCGCFFDRKRRRHDSSKGVRGPELRQNGAQGRPDGHRDHQPGCRSSSRAARWKRSRRRGRWRSCRPGARRSASRAPCCFTSRAARSSPSTRNARSSPRAAAPRSTKSPPARRSSPQTGWPSPGRRAPRSATWRWCSFIRRAS